MRLIRTIRLIRRQKHSTVHCEIDLCELPDGDARYLVNVRQGRSGDDWRERTRTPQPVDLAAAEHLFAQVLAERRAQGFTDAQDLPPAQADDTAPAAALDPERRAADAVLLGRLDPGVWRRLKDPQRTRTVWRIGERRLAAVVPLMVSLIGRGTTALDYCLAWAIGRCGDTGASEAMRELSTRGSSDAVCRIARQAWLQLADEAELRQHADQLTAAWPAHLRDAWAARDQEAIAQLCAQSDQWSTLSLSDWLEQLDQVALADPLARSILLAQLRQVPLRAGTFRAVRHIYKAAEMREDGELFGLIHQRFETTPAQTSSTYVRVERKWVPYAEMAARPDSTVAYSTRTRAYLLLRGWRKLRRLAQDGEPAFVNMATGALLAMDDADAGQPYTRAGRYYMRDGRYDRHADRSHDAYSHWTMFNRLLRSHGAWTGNRSGRSWFQTGPIVPASGREEAFPALWDARPGALLLLMQRSRCEGVHAFAARALAANTAFCATLSLDQLGALLRSPYSDTARFAFHLCRQRFADGVPDSRWLQLLLQSSLPEARTFALECISRAPDHYCADALLVAALACSPDEAVRRHGRMLCQCALALPGQADVIVLLLLDWLDNCGDLDRAEMVVPEIAADLVWLLDRPLRAAAGQAPYARLLALLGHRLASVRIAAGEWLLRHAEPAGAIPPQTLAALLQESDAGVRAVGIKLFSALPEHMLAGQALLFAVFCTHPDAGVRRAIDNALQRIAPTDAVFRATLLPLLLDTLFQSEPAEGVHADLIAWILGPLNSGADHLDRALLVRLLSARSKGAQLLGAQMLPRFATTDFGVAEWAQFGRNENASVRRWACAAFTEHAAQVRGQMEAALRLLDSTWDDTRAFAHDFFSRQCASEDWTPTLLVSLCDHLDPEVQRFGRTMLMTHFDVADVTEYMLKLSQHPSANMQLFVSSWLASASAGDLSKLERLEPYFLNVLSQVNRGRVAKNRVLDFLRAQAHVSEAIAAFVARLFARQVLTVAIADKAQYIEGLRAIQERFPALPAVMTIEPPRAHANLRGAP
ncbi:hypothetical protein INH39_15835 [Massilia violaceinigra]|uniref:WGR domain-containing protein n=1 Tax=Massilia violaceinigra TaxID=2045208 RepID=A0ABY4AGC6_9BURK|nr:hypothetical protein [Massilia violaceinigra]UOD32979.1 hypothetical protein INH39_15835 [Massilia violaceinigra]